MLGQSQKRSFSIDSPPKSICILRLSAIGDVCHAVAMVQHIQSHWPETTITWIVGKVEYSLVKYLPNINFVVFDKKQGIAAYTQLYRTLKHTQFDVLFHMQVAIRASLASLCIKAKIKIGFDEKRAKEAQWLFTNKQIVAQQSPHVLDGFFAFPQSLGIEPKAPTWTFPIPDTDELWASEQLTGVKPFAIICPAASKAIRNWTVDGYGECADYLSSLGFQVAICGGPTAMEETLAKCIIEKSQHTLVNLVGKTSLIQLLAILKRAHIVIAPDTGPAHMAVTVGTPVVGLYAHSNPDRTGPYLYRQYLVSVYEKAILSEYGKPVSQLSWGIRAKGENLMQQIAFTEVKSKIDELLTTEYPELVLFD